MALCINCGKPTDLSSLPLKKWDRVQCPHCELDMFIEQTITGDETSPFVKED